MAGRSPFEGRLRRVRTLMAAQGLDLVALFPSVNLAYLTGFREEASERLLLYLVPRDGTPVFLVPLMYRDHVINVTGAQGVVSWEDGEDPAKELANLLGDLGVREGTIALDTQLWARFFLTFLRVAPGARYRDAADVMEEVRLCKDRQEVQALARGFAATDRVMAAGIEAIGVGRTERDVGATIAEEFRRRGADQPSFDPIVGSGANGALPHHRAGGRKIRRGDAVVLDIGGLFGGYCTDMTRTVFVGKPTAQQARVYEAVAGANEAAFGAVRPGAEAQAVDLAARSFLRSRGLAEFFTHRTGHGIGLEVHEQPYIVQGNRRPLAPGMAFSIEPGVYLRGKFGVRLEDVVVAGPRPRRLDRYPRGLQAV